MRSLTLTKALVNFITIWGCETPLKLQGHKMGEDAKLAKDFMEELTKRVKEKREERCTGEQKLYR